MKNIFLCSFIVVAMASCMHGSNVKDVDFPATPIDMTKITKVGKACFKVTGLGTGGSGSVLQAAKNGDIKKVHMIEYSDEFEAGGFIQKKCTTVYGE